MSDMERPLSGVVQTWFGRSSISAFDPSRTSPWLMLAGNRIQTAGAVDRFFADFLFVDASRAKNTTPI
jgi:hypothetical protein